MTLLGKILTVCIFIMSLVFMSFAVMVFATHTNWKEVVMDPTTGLKARIEKANQEYNQLKTQLDSLRAETERERAARTQAIAALESRLLQINQELATRETLLAEKTSQLAILLETMRTTENQLVGLTDEVTGLRAEIRDIQGQRDKYFGDVVATTDMLHRMQDIETGLTETRNDLLAEVSRYKLVLDREGLELGIPTKPPVLDGYITKLSSTNKQLVEVSLGTDDGLRVGHYLEVSRNGNYIGRLAVVRVAPDQAVGQILEELQRRPMQVNDVVRTKTN